MTYAADAWTRISAATTPVFSKDGGTLYHLRGTGLPQVWAMDLDGGNARQLSAHDEKVAFLRRSPTDELLIWGIDAGGDERQQFWLLEPGAAPRAITDNPAAIHDFGAWSPDGTRIAYASNDRDERLHDICVLDLASGGRMRLFEGPGIVSISNWKSDGATLVMREDFSSTDQRLFLLDAATGAARELGRKGPTRYAGVRFTPDGTLMGITDHGGAEFMRLCRIDPTSGDATEVFAPEGRDVEAWALSPDGRQLATVENDRGYAALRVGAIGSERPAVTGLPEGIVADLAWAPESLKLAFVAQGPTAPASIWLWQDGAARPVPLPDPFAGSGIDPAHLVAPELVEWTSFDGTKIPGFYALPRSPKPADGYKAVVWVHGGPASQTRANFRPDIQMLLDQGFAVLMPNMRGSTGYGRSYMEADEVAKRPDMMEDLAAGRAWLAARPEIDAERIGIMGQSYGGWVVLAAVTMQPDLWKAAVNYYGIADFVTLLERTGPWRREHRAREYGFPETDTELFLRISPIHHVGNVVAPLLVLHGDRDPRVPMHESDQFVAAMEGRQKKVRYERFEYAGHGFIRPEHRRRVYVAVAEHFSEWL
jgi:dipeptidyl aminopeptidase/acylaminoacyl peptidase